MQDDLWPPEASPPPPPDPPTGSGEEPPGPEQEEGAKLPWEDRKRWGLVDAFVETLRLLLMQPGEAWKLARNGTGTWNALSFAIIIICVAVALTLLWVALLGGLDPDIPSKMGVHADVQEFNDLPLVARLGLMLAIIPFAMLGMAFVTPVILFITAAIVHLALSLVGALHKSPTGFDGTLRVVCYAQASQIASVIPAVGGVVALIWELVLAVGGVRALHRTSLGRAVAGVLLPFALCCLMLVMVGVMAGVAALACCT